MKRKEIEIVASFSGKISTGPYENANPFFSIKETWTDVQSEEFIESRQKELHQMCYSRFAEHEKKAIVDKLKRQHANLRFYEVNGEQFPSVTSIINWDADFFIPEEQLIQYAARGTIVHRQAELFLQTGQWVPVEEIPELHPENVIMATGSLGLTTEGFNFPAFIEKHPFETIKTEQRVVNTEYRYAGRCDIKAVFEGKVSIIDIKTGTVDKEKCFKQLAAYAMADGNEDVERIVVAPINNKTKQGFSKPVVEDNIEKYWALFKEDRKLFKKRFNV